MQNCPEIIACLTAGDFATFIRHLEGLVSVYALGPQASAPDKSRAFNALSCAERDLEKYFNTYKESTASAAELVHSTPLGLVEPRRGGLPMRMRYFLPPCHLIDDRTNTLMDCT